MTRPWYWPFVALAYMFFVSVPRMFWEDMRGIYDDRFGERKP
jgi:hypothetical protein